MDRFVEETGSRAAGCDPSHVMDYYDGNTVTGLWNYAQSFALNDRSFGTTFGPSHIGALNLVSGQTHGTVPSQPTTKVVQGTMVSNLEPTYDDCLKPALNAHMTGRNIGDLLNDGGVSWGWFSGGFRPTDRTADGSAVCGESHTTVFGRKGKDYDSGNEAFQYYASTANPHHLPPGSVAEVGHSGPANHQYDLTNFDAAADAGKLPAVSFLKAGCYEQGGCSCSSPLDEQNFIVGTINHLRQLPSCGYGPHLPLLVVSPYSRVNDHSLTDQTAIIRFVEDNWLAGRRIGDGSYDALAGSLTGMFDFTGHHRAPTLYLNRRRGSPRQETGTSDRASSRWSASTRRGRWPPVDPTRWESRSPTARRSRRG